MEERERAARQRVEALQAELREAEAVWERFVITRETVGEVLANVFAVNPEARGYVLDDQSALRKHITVFVDGTMIRDRTRLADAVGEASTVYVFQALSGG